MNGRFRPSRASQWLAGASLCTNNGISSSVWLANVDCFVPSYQPKVQQSSTCSRYQRKEERKKGQRQKFRTVAVSQQAHLSISCVFGIQLPSAWHYSYTHCLLSYNLIQCARTHPQHSLTLPFEQTSEPGLDQSGFLGLGSVSYSMTPRLLSALPVWFSGFWTPRKVWLYQVPNMPLFAPYERVSGRTMRGQVPSVSCRRSVPARQYWSAALRNPGCRACAESGYRKARCWRTVYGTISQRSLQDLHNKLMRLFK